MFVNFVESNQGPFLFRGYFCFQEMGIAGILATDIGIIPVEIQMFQAKTLKLGENKGGFAYLAGSGQKDHFTGIQIGIESI